MYATVFLSDGSKKMISQPLKSLESAISSHVFVRVHNSHLVNINYISRYIKNDGGYLMLKDGSRVPVAKRRKDSIFIKSRLL